MFRVNGYHIELTAASLTLTLALAAGINSSRTRQAELGHGEQRVGIKNLAVMSQRRPQEPLKTKKRGFVMPLGVHSNQISLYL